MGWWDYNPRSEAKRSMMNRCGVLRRTKCLRYSHVIKVTAKLSFASVVDRSPVAQCYANTRETISNRYEIETIRKFCLEAWTIGIKSIGTRIWYTNRAFKLS